MKLKKILARGAEAIIFLEKENILKSRTPKGYRNKELDLKLRESRTRKEKKLLKKAKELIPVPKIIENATKDKTSILIENLKGEKLSETLENYKEKEQKEIMIVLGKQVAKIHDHNIIHGDLTTSNVILINKTPHIIDFGLGFISQRIEDRAVDLHLIKQALEAKHWRNHKKLFEFFLEGYNDSKECKKTEEQLKKVESRGRYKH
ncbi:MAG: KEOPS complex kinase/ATPase Bud32 [Bacteroidales bacterium]|jgi:Kae1-associated kinase Bud32|nr:KEOPS complex kinase/ATPase Bud32 [Bacteroidales bacterium]